MAGDHSHTTRNLAVIDELLERRLQLAERLGRQADLGRFGFRQFTCAGDAERDERQEGNERGELNHA